MMEKKHFERPSKQNDEELARDYYLSEAKGDGVLRCSCGRKLVKIDEATYKCAAGFPIYRIDDGSLFIDKFGNIMLKRGDHDEDN